MMIFISSTCVKHKKIGEAFSTLAKQGYRYIELSGGIECYQDYVLDLQALKAEYGLTYKIHNYFPPLRDNFIFKLASLNDNVYQKSLTPGKGGLNLVKSLGSDCYGFHAGFFVDPRLDEIGRSVHITISENPNISQY